MLRKFSFAINIAPCVALFAFLPLSRAQSEEIKRFDPNEIVQLTAPTQFKFDEIIAGDGATIVTNGFPLDLVVDKRFEADGTFNIIVFQHAADEGKAGSPGAPGQGFNVGPYSGTASGPGQFGRNGGPGLNGGAGWPGQNGGLPSGIRIQLFGVATGVLNINAQGQNGGKGGRGGPGGRGGDGGQGGPAVPGRVSIFQIGCKLSAGRGGNGGQGGAGGDGARGGDAGFGATVSIASTADTSNFVVYYAVGVGTAGAGGQSGEGGIGGRAGFGGRGTGPCEGREGWVGVPGPNGTPGANGPSGAAGQPGSFEQSGLAKALEREQ